MSDLDKVKKFILDFDTELSEKGVGISGRSYLTTAILLAYCSVLRFRFQERLLPRGWMDILIIGDTRCGKTATAEYIVSNLRLGQLIKAENISYAGLIGGLHQQTTRAKWDIVWGKIPLNHGKLLIVDEMSSMSIDDIGNMSAVRSSGIAEVTKIQSGSTRAATRLVWLSNPRGGRPMSQYTHGVHAVAELIGKPEDIARFDFAVAVAQEDVPIDIVNKSRTGVVYEGKWQELRSLVLWAWHLKPGDVVFEPDAESAILDLAKAQARDYRPDIPLVEPNEQRIRLARVTVATAVRCYSESGGKLIVKRRHAEFADWFIRRCYDSRAMGYGTYSRMEATQEAQHIATVAEMREVLTKYATSPMPIRLIYQSDAFNMTDIEAYYNVSRAEAREIISSLLKTGCIYRRSTTFAKTRLGIQIIEGILNEVAANGGTLTRP